MANAEQEFTGQKGKNRAPIGWHPALFFLPWMIVGVLCTFGGCAYKAYVTYSAQNVGQEIHWDFLTHLFFEAVSTYVFFYGIFFIPLFYAIAYYRWERYKARLNRAEVSRFASASP